jgi:hypothetical protein
VRDLETILETLGDYSSRTKDVDMLTEHVRNALSRTISKQCVDENDRLFCIKLDPSFEDFIDRHLEQTEGGTTNKIPSQIARHIVQKLSDVLGELTKAGRSAVVLCNSKIRGRLRWLIEPTLPQVAVLAYNEVVPGIAVEVVAVVGTAGKVTGGVSPSQATSNAEQPPPPASRGVEDGRLIKRSPASPSPPAVTNVEIDNDFDLLSTQSTAPVVAPRRRGRSHFDRTSGATASPRRTKADSAKAVRHQQMMVQIANLVDESPDTAATIVRRWMPTYTSSGISGVRKAAIFLLCITQDQAAQILKRLAPEAVEQVCREIASLSTIDDGTRQDVCSEFYQLALVNACINEGGLEAAKPLPPQSHCQADAEKSICQMKKQVPTTRSRGSRRGSSSPPRSSRRTS